MVASRAYQRVSFSPMPRISPEGRSVAWTAAAAAARSGRNPANQSLSRSAWNSPAV